MDGAYAATTESLNLQSLDSACKPLQMTRVRLDDLTPTRPTAPVPGGAPPQTSGMTTRPATGAAATSRPNAPITFAALIDRLGEKGKNTQRLVGTQLQLQLKPGAIAGAEGFIQDVRMSTLFNCPAGSRFAGGPLTAKVKKLRVNDNGVFVDLDRCDN